MNAVAGNLGELPGLLWIGTVLSIQPVMKILARHPAKLGPFGNGLAGNGSQDIL